MDDVCRAIQFAMGELGVTASALNDQQMEAIQALFEAMIVSLSYQRGTVKHFAVLCCHSCSTTSKKELIGPPLYFGSLESSNPSP